MAVLPALVAAILVAVVALQPEHADGDPGRSSRLGPVLLVPGYGGSTAGIEVLAARLRAAGRQAVVVRVVGDGRGDLRRQVDVLDDAVRRTMLLTGSSSVDLVGYSAGGVIARLWVATSNGRLLARRVVTLGSPHHGTDLVGHAPDLPPNSCPVACVQLADGSDLLRLLNANDETPSGPSWVSIWTTHDATVPPVSSHLAGAVNFSAQSVCGDWDLGHGDLPRDPVVARLVTLELATDASAVPDSAACAT